jgi:hypothetical protein|tara:strand:- start:209 stop:583 length:375 start_codon:yes stop_codon:yes gene_type:complete
MTIPMSQLDAGRWEDELPDGMLGISETLSFTLDPTGEWQKSKSYNTGGVTVRVSGTISNPSGFTWNIKFSSSQGYSKTKDNIPTGEAVSFDIKTNCGITDVALTIASVNGTADAGVVGQIKIDS